MCCGRERIERSKENWLDEQLRELLSWAVSSKVDLSDFFKNSRVGRMFWRYLTVASILLNGASTRLGCFLSLGLRTQACGGRRREREGRAQDMKLCTKVCLTRGDNCRQPPGESRPKLKQVLHQRDSLWSRKLDSISMRWM